MTVAGGLVCGCCTHVMTVVGNGKFRVKQTAYSIAAANADITAGRFAGTGITASTVDIDGVNYTQISIP